MGFCEHNIGPSGAIKGGKFSVTKQFVFLKNESME
jgi:hypothetical protein